MEYLKLDSTRLSFGEYWRWKPGLPFLVLAATKVLGRRLGSTTLVPSEPTIVRVDEHAADPQLVAALGEPIRACEARGGVVRFWYAAPTLGQNVGLGAAVAGPDERWMALAIVAQRGAGPRREVVLGVVSRLRSGGYLATGPGQSIFDPPPEVRAIRMRGASYRELVEAHERAAGRMGDDIVFYGDAEAVILDLQRLQLRANVRRGVYVPASAAEVAAAGGRPTSHR